MVKWEEEMETEKITDEDLDMVRYFWEEKGDVTRWVQWKEKLPLLRKQYPELVDAVDRYRIAVLTLSAVIKEVCT